MEKHAYMQENSNPDLDPIPDYLIFLNILKAGLLKKSIANETTVAGT